MTRDEILVAAAQIFSQKGFHATSMQDIAQAVNLQKASLYHHVSSKQEILVDVLDRALDLLIERMQEVMALPLAPDEMLRQAMQVYLSTLLEHRDLAAVLLLEHRNLDPELPRSPHPSKRPLRAAVARFDSAGAGGWRFLLHRPGYDYPRPVGRAALDHHLVPARRHLHPRRDRRPIQRPFPGWAARPAGDDAELGQERRTNDARRT